MKRFIKNIPTVHIYIDYVDVIDDIAAATEFKELQHPNIKRRYKKSDEWLKKVNDLARSIIGSMQGRKFKIIDAHPSKKSYTYYIRFQPADKNGDLWDQVLEFQIELRDHISKNHPDIGPASSKLFIKAYYIDDASYRNMYEIMQALWNVMDELEIGNFSSFGL